ncbi:MAG TPA: IclR family transcriptional regulator [Candidatus Nanopelagicaceae bacterium]|nr:IclR family transcriptional regulator [Candidatus Nanopelagicaceae bacterium]
MEKSTPAASGTQAVNRASALLVHVLEADKPLLLTELALAHGLAKSTTSRILGALERANLVQRDGDGAFQPGGVLTKFARTRGGEADLAARFHPVLERISLSTGETANLAIVGHGAVDLIDQVDGHYLLGAKNWVGTNVPLHCSALGKVLLAFGAATMPTGRLARRTSATITSKVQLEEELTEVRTHGFAAIYDELEEGLVAVAAPVREVDGTVVGSISVSGPSTRITRDRIEKLGALLITEITAEKPTMKKEGAA